MTTPSHPNPEERSSADGRDAGAHPEELLAAYVDHTASPAEVAEAEAHLATCQQCVDDVAAARGAFAALRDMPELDSPWAADGSLAATASGRRPGAPVVSIRERRSRRWLGTAAAGLAAAAILATIAVFVPRGGSSNESGARATSGAAAPLASANQMTQADLQRLTAALASTAGETTPGQTLAASGSSGVKGSERFGPAAETIAPEAVAGIPCARRVTGQADSTLVVHAQLATFEGRRVYVVGFVTSPASGQEPRVEVVAVTTKGCTLVFVARQPIGR